MDSSNDVVLVEKAIDDALNQMGLTVTLRGSLKKYPGCIHWHVKNGSCAGTLEVTLWPSSGRAWLTVQHGRRANWIDGIIAPLLAVIQRRMTE